MNILVIMTDQLSFRTLRAYGGREEFTTIDTLFAKGATVDQVYTPCPLCLPARASFWTSRLPHRTGALSNGRLFQNRSIGDDTPTLGSIFGDAGWECVHFGKEHDAGALRGFQRMPGGEAPVEPVPGYPVNVDTFRDRYTADQTVAWFGDRAGTPSHARKPLLAVVDLVNPHNICGWVGEMARHVLGPDADVVPAALRAPSYETTPGFPPDKPSSSLPALPQNFKDSDFHTRPRSVQYQCCAHNRLAQTQGWSEREFRLYLDAYHHYTHLADSEIARILASAQAALDMDETFVVFSSDHGDAIAAHAGVTKHTTFYEETTRVPFAISGPRIEPGLHIPGPASLLDLVLTLVDLSGISDHPGVREACLGMDGISLAPALLGDQPMIENEGTHSRERSATPRFVVSEWHTEWGYTIEPGRMITDGRYKLMRYAEGGDEEFYDLEIDPYEMCNLIPLIAGAENHADLGTSVSDARTSLSILREELRAHFARTNDPFESLAAVADNRWRSHAPGYHNHDGVAAPEAAT